jgi:hypothetical protein
MNEKLNVFLLCLLELIILIQKYRIFYHLIKVAFFKRKIKI